MNGSKLIHVLLIAMLCYGQLVSSVHAVGHLELADCDAKPSKGHHHHGEHDDLSVPHVTDHHHSHPPLADTHTDIGSPEKSGSGSHTELDCKIYHAFQNLNGIGGTSLPPLTRIARQDTGTTYILQHFVSDSLDIPQIRAPPVLS